MQFLGRELRELRVIGGTEHAAGRVNLDDLGSRTQYLPDLLAYVLRAIAAAVGVAGVWLEQVELVARRHPAVAVSARDGQGANGDLHTRSRYDAPLDRRFHVRVGAAGVAHGRNARVERAAHVVDGLVEVERERSRQHRGDVEALYHQVDVRVDEAGQDIATARVDARDRAVRRHQARRRTYRADMVALNEDGRIADWLAAIPINQRAIVYDVGHEIPLTLPTSDSRLSTIDYRLLMLLAATPLATVMISSRRRISCATRSTPSSAARAAASSSR